MMKNKFRIVVAAMFIAGGGKAQEEEAPQLLLGKDDARVDAVAPERDSPSLADGFSAPLAYQRQQAKVEAANAQLELYNYDAAEILFKEVLKESPGNTRALIGLSVIYTQRYEYAEALKLLEFLLTRDPNNIALKNNAAWIYATADDSEIRDGHRAVELAREALVDAPGSYHVWSTMAEGYYVTGQFSKALDAAEEGMRMAIFRGASADNLREYRAQITKSLFAVKALSLLE